jgi:hypothetical protein
MPTVFQGNYSVAIYPFKETADPWALKACITRIRQHIMKHRTFDARDLQECMWSNGVQGSAFIWHSDETYDAPDVEASRAHHLSLAYTYSDAVQRVFGKNKWYVRLMTSIKVIGIEDTELVFKAVDEFLLADRPDLACDLLSKVLAVAKEGSTLLDKLTKAKQDIESEWNLD